MKKSYSKPEISIIALYSTKDIALELKDEINGVTVNNIDGVITTTYDLSLFQNSNS